MHFEDNTMELQEFLQTIDVEAVRQTLSEPTVNQVLVRQVGRRIFEWAEQATWPETSTPEQQYDDEALRRIYDLSRKYSHSLPQFSAYFEEWEPKRKASIETLTTYAEKLEQNAKASAKNRLLFSSLDLAGVAGGLILKQQDTWANAAFKVGLWSVVLGCIFNLKDQNTSSAIHSKVLEAVQQDEEAYKPMREWLQKSRELDNAWRALLPQGTLERFLERIQHETSHRAQTAIIFEEVFVAYVAQKPDILLDPSFIKGVYRFATSPEADLGVISIFSVFHEDPLVLDCAKLMVQLLSTTTGGALNYGALMTASSPEYKLLIAARVCLSSYSAGSAIWDLVKKTDRQSEMLLEFRNKIQTELGAVYHMYQVLSAISDANRRNMVEESLKKDS